MAFYNKTISKNRLLNKAWRAGHQIKLDENEEICLPEICDEIGNLMRRSRHPRDRLSLRSFSVLLSGAVRLYKDEVDKLLKDTLDCTSLKRPASPKLTPNASDSEYVTADIPSDRSKSNSTSKNDESSGDDELSVEESTVYTVPSDDKRSTANFTKETSMERKDKSVQTSPTLEIKRNNAFSQDFDPNLPFGYIIVHDNYNSRIPKRIIFSSLSEDMRF